MPLIKFLSRIGVVAVLIWFSIFLMTLTSADHLSKEAVGSDHLTSLHSDIDYELDADHKLADDMPGAYPRLPFCSDLGSKTPSDHDAENSSSADKQLQPSVQNFRGRFTIVATLDGQLSLLDHGGHKLWTIKTGQVFSSTISSIPLHENGKWVHMIPSLTGGLYRYDGDSLQPMPLNAEDLLLRSFKLSNDVVMSGGKEVRTYGIDLSTGSLRYECGMEGCSSPTAAEASAVENDNGVVLVVKKQMQTVRAIDSITGSEKWNFSVATHELALAGVREGCYEGESKGGSLDSKIKVIIPDGLIMGAGPDNNSVWQHKFDHPIAQTWVLENGRLSIVDPIKHSVLDQTPALYIGKHAHQLYVQESQDTAKKLETAIASVSKREILPKPLEIGWKPSHGEDGDSYSHALAPYQHDFNGVYFYESDEIQNIHNGAFEEVPEDESGYIIDLPSVWHWWKEVLGFSLILAVVLNVLLMWPIARLIRDQTVRRMIELFRPILTQRANEVVAREEVKPLLVPALPAPVPNRRSRTRTLSNASTASQSYMDDSSSPFVSQYLREFEPITCLGRGGFGVVFEAKKKIDDRHYAVKRIILPNSEKSRGRVMREVKALAKLDHRNIVRYFNAWIENPPMGWLELNDPLYNSCLQDISSGFYRSSVDVTATVDESRDRKIKNRREYCEVSFPKGESQGDDSYIIFAADGNSNKSVESESNDGGNGRMSGGDGGSTALLLKQFKDSSSSSESGGFFRRPKSLNLTSMECSVNMGELDIVADEDLDKSDDENVFPSETYLYIQQELCQKKTLQEWLRVTKNRSHQQVVAMFSQIVEAVEYIHMNKLIHRDLKPGNIFLASSENASMENETMTVKIGDFGLATTGVHFENDAHTPSMISPPVRVNLTGHVGTHMYMSPEQARNEPYDFKVDIYSLGLIFYELLVPLTTDMERHESLSQIRKMKFPPWFLQDHELEHSILAQMVSHDPFKRPSASEIRTWLLKNLVGRPSKTFSTPAELGISNHSPDATTGTAERYNNNNDRDRRFSKNHSFT